MMRPPDAMISNVSSHEEKETGHRAGVASLSCSISDELAQGNMKDYSRMIEAFIMAS